MKNKLQFLTVFILLFILKSNAQNETNWVQILSLTQDGRHKELSDIKLDSKNNKWLVSRDGILKIDENEKVLFDFNSQNSPILSSSQIVIDFADNLWVMTNQNDILMFDGKDWTKYSIDNKDFQNKRFHGISVSSDQTVWISLIGVGIVKLKDGKFTYYNTKNSNLSSNQIYRVYVLNDIPWFINNSENLLIKYNSNTDDFIEYIPLFAKEPSLYMDKMNVDKKGNLWIGSLAHSVLIFNTNEEKFYSLLPYGEKAEITSPSFSRDGSAYFINVAGQLMKYSDSIWTDNLDGFVTGFLNSSNIGYCAKVLVDKNDALYIPTDQGLVFNKSEKVITSSTHNITEQIMKYNIYPNPATDFFKIEIIQKHEIYEEGLSVKLFTIDGREVMSGTIELSNISNTIFPVSNLSSGIYIIQIKSAGQISTHKIIKE